MIWLRVFASLVLFISTAAARELYPGQYAQTDPKKKEWFQNQKVPRGSSAGHLCCSVADGVYAEEDQKGAHYWVRFVATWVDSATGQPGERQVDWMEVPDDVVIRDPNPYGSAVVWWAYNQKEKQFWIRCFIPGGGV